MALRLICLIAFISTTAFLYLWFQDVRHIMNVQKSTVESAKAQLGLFCQKAYQTKDDSDTAAILERSKSIYRQAVEHYNRTLRKPWIYPPAALMGFRPIRNESENP